jgi:hypothetical protein
MNQKPWDFKSKTRWKYRNHDLPVEFLLDQAKRLKGQDYIQKRSFQPRNNDIIGTSVGQWILTQ